MCTVEWKYFCSKCSISSKLLAFWGYRRWNIDDIKRQLESQQVLKLIFEELALLESYLAPPLEVTSSLSFFRSFLHFSISTTLRPSTTKGKKKKNLHWKQSLKKWIDLYIQTGSRLTFDPLLQHGQSVGHLRLQLIYPESPNAERSSINNVSVNKKQSWYNTEIHFFLVLLVDECITGWTAPPLGREHSGTCLLFL